MPYIVIQDLVHGSETEEDGAILPIIFKRIFDDCVEESPRTTSISKPRKR
jgi:hypothetical protein